MSRLSRPARLAALGWLVWMATAGLERGRVHPDEVFQYLEPAHRFAFGYGQVAWEWQEGLRNWAVPGALGLLLKALALLGLDHPWAFAGASWALLAFAQACGAVALYRLVEEQDGERAAAFGTFVYVTWGGMALYAARSLGDAISVAPLVGALLWSVRAHKADSWRAGAAAGALLGAAFVVRYPSAVFAVPVFVWLLAGRRLRSCAGLALGMTAVLGALLALDLATWGFPTAWRYLHYNVLSGGSRQHGVQPFWFYAVALAGLAPVLLVVHFALGCARRRIEVYALATYLIAMSLLGHKEARFLVPVLPLFVAVAAAPAAKTWERLASAAAWRRGALMLLYLASSVAAATVQRTVGQHTELLDAQVRVGRDPRLTGLIVDGAPWWRTGGSFYLHRDVPVVFATPDSGQKEASDALADPRFTHAVATERAALAQRLAEAGFVVQRRDGATTEWRRGPSPVSPSQTDARF
ncbi:MAG: glycosyltransferase family 39 protein [Myxococcales bacterium]